MQGLNREGCGRPLGLVLPDCIDGIGREGEEFCANLYAGRGKALSLIGGEQPRVVTQDVAFFQVFSNPCCWRFIDKMVGREELGIDLLAHLDGIAAINEYRPLVKG